MGENQDRGGEVMLLRSDQRSTTLVRSYSAGCFNRWGMQQRSGCSATLFSC